MRISIYEQQNIQTPNPKIPTRIKIATQSKHSGLLSQSASQIDPRFPPSLTSIGSNIRPDLLITWQHLQDYYRQSSYSQNITDLQMPEYCVKSLTQCLLIMNWFVPQKFTCIFSDRIVSKLRKYQYLVHIRGKYIRMWVDSQVPIKQGNVLFAQAVNGSIFGALFQKVMAKIYGSYQAIDDNLVNNLSIWTHYPVQTITNRNKNPSLILKTLKNALQQKSLILFKTRNSIRLHSKSSLSLAPSSTHLISRILTIKNTVIVQFLQLDVSSNWRGACSRGSQFWNDKQQQMEIYKISKESTLQNYINFEDFIGIIREVYILHRVNEDTSVNWVTVEKSVDRHVFSIRVSALPQQNNIKNNIQNNNKQQTLLRIAIHTDTIERQQLQQNEQQSKSQQELFEDSQHQQQQQHKQKKDKQKIRSQLYTKPCTCIIIAYVIHVNSNKIAVGKHEINRDRTYIQLQVMVNQQYMLYLYYDNILSKPINPTVTAYSDTALWCTIQQKCLISTFLPTVNNNQLNSTVNTYRYRQQQQAWLHYLNSHPQTIYTHIQPNCTIKIKNLYIQYGIALIGIQLDPQYYKQVVVHLHNQRMRQIGIQLINASSVCQRVNVNQGSNNNNSNSMRGKDWVAVKYCAPCYSVLMFKFGFKFSLKQGDSFPNQSWFKLTTQLP